MYFIYCVKQLKKLPEGDILHFDRDHEGSQQIRFRITEEVSNIIICTCVFQMIGVLYFCFYKPLKIIRWRAHEMKINCAKDFYQHNTREVELIW